MATIPVRCPVCEGKGLVQPGFYPDSHDPQWAKCRSCSGSGVLYAMTADPLPVPVVPAPWSPQPWSPPWSPTVGDRIGSSISPLRHDDYIVLSSSRGTSLSE